MKPRDEITALAAEYLRNREAIAKHVGDAFASLPKAPLARIIEDFLATSPRINVAPLLRKIAETNQGTIDDLNSAEFRSYLIDVCDTNDVQLRAIISALGNFRAVQEAKLDSDKHVAVAARDEGNSGQNRAVLSDLQKQLGNRVR